MVNKIQLGLLYDFVSWIRTGALEDPFSYYQQDGITFYVKSTLYKLQNPYHEIEKDIQALIEAGFLLQLEIDGKTHYTPTEAGRKAVGL